MPHGTCNKLQHKRKMLMPIWIFPRDVAHFERALCCLISPHTHTYTLFPSLSLSFSLSLFCTHSCVSCYFSPAATSNFTWPHKLHKVFAAFPIFLCSLSSHVLRPSLLVLFPLSAFPLCACCADYIHMCRFICLLVSLSTFPLSLLATICVLFALI